MLWWRARDGQPSSSPTALSLCGSCRRGLCSLQNFAQWNNKRYLNLFAGTNVCLQAHHSLNKANSFLNAVGYSLTLTIIIDGVCTVFLLMHGPHPKSPLPPSQERNYNKKVWPLHKNIQDVGWWEFSIGTHCFYTVASRGIFSIFRA